MTHLKYDENIRLVRKLTKKILLELLSEKPLSSAEIKNKIKKKFPSNCDDKIKCECGRGVKTLEWEHQVAWAIQDVKSARKIEYLKDNKKYAILNKES